MSRIIPKLITRAAGRLVLKTKKNSPHLLFGAGVVGVVGGTVLACRATLKLDKTLDECGAELAHHRNNSTQPKMVQVYTKNTWKVTKLYAPAVLVGGVGIACLSGAHVQLTRRNGALTIAYAGAIKAFDEYRERVRGAIGEEKELNLYHGLEIEKVKIDGKTVELAKADVNKLSMYSVIFDELNKEYRKDAELNRLFLTSQQHYFNQLLQLRGHVFLNEVYENLGFNHTSPGSIVGWVIGKEGDNYVDFGMYNCDSSRFINGDERAIILDFNVDGVIYDKI